MVVTNRICILSVSLISGIATAFHIVSLSTDYWVTGTIFEPQSDSPKNSVNYGLFRGYYTRDMFTNLIYMVEMTCSFEKNVCILLCGDEYYRKETLNKLISNKLGRGDTDFMSPCYSTSSYVDSFPFPSKSFQQNNIKIQSKYFINAGVWLSTVICLVVATFLGLTSSVLSFYNIVGNIRQFYFSIGSLYIYNGLAFLFTLLYIIFWGALYNLIIFHNLGVTDTLTGLMSSDRNAFLGYSYWINFIPLILYGVNMGILYYREYLNAKNLKYKTVHLEDSTNNCLN